MATGINKTRRRHWMREQRPIEETRESMADEKTNMVMGRKRIETASERENKKNRNSK